MPTTKPQKSVNLSLEDHARAQRIAGYMTDKARTMTGIELKPFTIKDAIEAALKSYEFKIEPQTKES